MSDGIQQTRNDLQRSAWRDILYATLAGAGLGAATRSGIGAYNMFDRAVRSTPADTLRDPVPAIPGDEEDDEKQADESASAPFPAGDWAYPALTSAGAIGGMGLGFGALDQLLDVQKDEQQEAELERARREFRKAIRQRLQESPYQRHQQKTAGDELGTQLDRIYDHFVEHSDAGQQLEKGADFFGIGDALSKEFGKYLGYYGVPAAMIPAYLAYSQTRKRGPHEVTEKALDERMRRRHAQQPSPVTFDLPEPAKDEDEDEEKRSWREALAPVVSV